MVVLTLFENTLDKQAVRVVIAFLITALIDSLWVFLINNNKFKSPFDNPLWKNKGAYFNVWITIAIVFGVSTLKRDNNDKPLEINNDSIKDYIYYGMLIGLLIYVPLYNWLLSCVINCGKCEDSQTYTTPLEALGNTAFGIVLCSAVCLLTYMISVKISL